MLTVYEKPRRIQAAGAGMFNACEGSTIIYARVATALVVVDVSIEIGSLNKDRHHKSTLAAT